MPRLEAFEVPGCRCWFHSNDHRPAHFHAGVSGEWEIRVFFLHDPCSYEIVFNVKKISGSILRDVLEAAREHRTALLEEWSAKVLLPGEQG